MLIQNWSEVLDSHFSQKTYYVVIGKFEKEYLGPISDDAKNIFETMLMNIVTFHDFGKVNPIFQKKKMGHEFGLELWHRMIISGVNTLFFRQCFISDYFLGRIKELEDRAERELLKDFAYINSYLIISRHHGKLVDLEQYLNSLSGRSAEGEDLGVRARAWLENWKREGGGRS